MAGVFGVWPMLVFGVLGCLFKKLMYPLVPLVLVLGDLAERSFRQAMLLSQGSLAIFWSSPLLGAPCGLALLMLLWPLHGALRGAPRRREVRRDGRLAS